MNRRRRTPPPKQHWLRRLNVRAVPSLICLLYLVGVTPAFGQALLTTAKGTTWSSAATSPAPYRNENGLLPVSEGTTWNYEMVQERPSASFDLTEPNEKERFAVTYRAAGTQKLDNKDLLKIEVYRGDTLENVDLFAVDEHGVVSPARLDAAGTLTRFDPPQTLVAAPLRNHASWNFEGQIGDREVNQRYEIAGEENVDVPAGKFHAWRIHCEQTSPTLATIDRWFVPGTGFVKVVTTVKSASGGMLQQTSLVLKEASRPGPRSEPGSSANAGKFSVMLSNEPDGRPTTTFSANAPEIYARWQGHNLRPSAKVSAVWVADNTENAPADYKIGEASAIVKTADSAGTFTLERPEGGWTLGDYRVEFHVDDEFAQTVKFHMAK
jgi:hypothetical protein